MLRLWSHQARQLTPRRGTVAHLGNQGCCVHIDTGNLSGAKHIIIKRSLALMHQGFGGWFTFVCVYPVWVPCVALPSGGGSSVGPSPLCGSPVWVPCVGPLCVGPLWVPCVGPSARRVASCGIYSRDVSSSFTRSRSTFTRGRYTWGGATSILPRRREHLHARAIQIKAQLSTHANPQHTRSLRDRAPRPTHSVRSVL